MKRPMVALLLAIRSRFTSRARLEAENLILRQQLVAQVPETRETVEHRSLAIGMVVSTVPVAPGCDHHRSAGDRDPLAPTRFPRLLALEVPPRRGRPRMDCEIRALIRRISRENPLWGAPRIHGELLMLGIELAESTVGRYMVRRRRPPSQGWKTFLRNHAAGMASLDLFVVRTISSSCSTAW